jgi:hypothetical protein
MPTLYTRPELVFILAAVIDEARHARRATQHACYAKQTISRMGTKS